MSAGNRPSQPLTACFIDGSALYFASRQLFPEASIDYSALFQLFGERFGPQGQLAGDAPLLPPGSSSSWVFWTAYSDANVGQAQFLTLLGGRFGVETRRFAPRDSRIVEGLGDALADRVTRFDASIAYMIGRLAETHRFVVISDSFALAEPLARAARVRYENCRGAGSFAPNAITFFGRALDPRWFGAVRAIGAGAAEPPVVIMDLDDDADRIVGIQGRAERDWFAPVAPRRPTRRPN